MKKNRDSLSESSRSESYFIDKAIMASETGWHMDYILSTINVE